MVGGLLTAKREAERCGKKGVEPAYKTLANTSLGSLAQVKGGRFWRWGREPYEHLIKEGRSILRDLAEWFSREGHGRVVHGSVDGVCVTLPPLDANGTEPAGTLHDLQAKGIVRRANAWVRNRGGGSRLPSLRLRFEGVIPTFG